MGKKPKDRIPGIPGLDRIANLLMKGLDPQAKHKMLASFRGWIDHRFACPACDHRNEVDCHLVRKAEPKKFPCYRLRGMLDEQKTMALYTMFLRERVDREARKHPMLRLKRLLGRGVRRIMGGPK